MSMLARYVQVTASELADLGDDPSSIPELFTDMSLTPFLRASDQMRERMQETAPRVFSQALSTLHPSVRDRLAERLGVDPDNLESDEAGNALLELMQGKGLVQFGNGAPYADDDDRPSLSLDKAWHGLSYLLAGQFEPTDTPPGNAVLGGTEIGDDDHGYGPARFFVPAEVEEIAEALTRPELEAEIRARYRPDTMTSLGVYPGGWDDEALDWLLNGFEDLREFFREAAAQHSAVLTCLV